MYWLECPLTYGLDIAFWAIFANINNINLDVMKLKFYFCLLSLFSLLPIHSMKASLCLPDRGVEITLSVTDEPFTRPHGPEHGSRSIPTAPFSAFIDDSHIIDIDFYEAINEIEIIISQNGEVIYSSSENIASPISKNIQLPSDLSGNFLLEIKNSEGAYAFGNFDL